MIGSIFKLNLAAISILILVYHGVKIITDDNDNIKQMWLNRFNKTSFESDKTDQLYHEDDSSNGYF